MARYKSNPRTVEIPDIMVPAAVLRAVAARGALNLRDRTGSVVRLARTAPAATPAAKKTARLSAAEIRRREDEIDRAAVEEHRRNPGKLIPWNVAVRSLKRRGLL